MNGNSTAASRAMMASTHTISSKVKPRSAPSLIFRTGQVIERNVGGYPAAAFLAVGAVRYDVIGSVLPWRTVDVAVVPGIVGDVAALEIGPVPGSDAWRRPDQGCQAFRCRWKAAGIEIEQVERAAEALQLNLGCLDLGFAEIVQNTRTDQPHDEPNNGDHHQHFDQRKALLAQLPGTHFPRVSMLCAPNEETADVFDRYHDKPTSDLANQLSDRQQRGHDRHDQPADHGADGDNGKRPDDANDAIEAALQLCFVEFRDPGRQRRQLAG